MWLAWNGEKIEGVAVTELLRSDHTFYCVVQACGGSNVRHWITLLDKIEEYARDEDCEFIRILGRRGWKRLLKNYKEKLVVLERPLTK